MILTSVRVHDFKNITDSSDVDLTDGVTCLVGKNESGKTAFLEALYRLNPLSTGHPTKFVPLRDFPRPRHGREQGSIGEVEAVTARFVLEDADVKKIESEVGAGVVQDREVEVGRCYDNSLLVSVEADESKAVKHLVSQSGLDSTLAKGVSSIEQLREKLQEIESPSEGQTALVERLVDLDVGGLIRKAIVARLPQFLYFDSYSELPSRISIPYLQNTDEAELGPGERTALSLLRLASADLADFDHADNEMRVAALEAASSALTSEVFEYWTQNTQLRVKLNIDWKVSDGDGVMQPPFLDIRIENLRHGNVSLSFGERSTGFQWFFSFLTAFSEYRDDDRDIVLLLDEPGLGLHAAAQGDFLRYIDEQLAVAHRVIYSTHSPFMVEPTQIGRVRLVEDKGDDGTEISGDVLTTNRDTVFPIQAALGYELAQSLFVGSDNLLVEGPSDLLYMTAISDHLRSLNRDSLDQRWTIVPVGGMEKIPTFIALLGSQLNLTVLVDGAKGGNQRIKDMVEKHLIDEGRVLAISEFASTNRADIEDLFDTRFYLDLAKASGITAPAPSALPPTGRIVKRIEKKAGEFDHYQPAAFFVQNQGEWLSQLDDGTLDRFEALIQAVNATLVVGDRSESARAAVPT